MNDLTVPYLHNNNSNNSTTTAAAAARGESHQSVLATQVARGGKSNATAVRRRQKRNKNAAEAKQHQTHAVTLLMMVYARARASSRTSSWDTSVATLKSSRASNVPMSSPAAMLPSGASCE